MYAGGPDIAGNFSLLLNIIVANRSNTHHLSFSVFIGWWKWRDLRILIFKFVFMILGDLGVQH